jgi:AI-2 transport protein TqsA
MRAGETKADIYRVLMISAAVVVVVAGLRAAASLLVPFLLSIFIAIICAPALLWLQNRRVPTWLALLLIVGVVGLLGFSVVAIIGGSVGSFTDSLPFYQTQLETQGDELRQWVQTSFGVTVSPETLSGYLNVSSIMRLVTGVLSGLGGILTNGFMILLTVIFMLLEASTIPAKLRLAFGETLGIGEATDRFVVMIKRYMIIKTATSLAEGVLVTIWLMILGVDFPVLWGLLAFLMNYVPTIGSFIAAAPPMILALVQLGVGPSLLTAVGYLVINNVIGNLIEPRFLGRGVGLSTLVVFVSLVFWGWVLGPVGMFLSVPLTMTVKIALENNHSTRWLSILLDSETTKAAPAKAE